MKPGESPWLVVVMVVLSEWVFWGVRRVESIVWGVMWVIDR
jgi:hypothetical protein